ncbi:MAG: hypothetical protein ACOCX1_05630 [Fimbriimonadaceae bacterium]
MKFRRLYWVTESIDADGVSTVTGIYTSIPTLVHKGLTTTPKGSHLRLSLMRLDSPSGPLHQWNAAEFGNIEEVLRKYISTGDFTHAEVEMLSGAVVQNEYSYQTA